MDDADTPDRLTAAIGPRFPDVADHAPVPLFSTDAAGRYVFVNKRWSDLTGIAGRDALGWGWERALHPDDVAGVVDRWRRCVATGEDLHARMRLVRPDGRLARVHMHAVAAPGRRGRTGFVGTLALLPAARAAVGPTPAIPAIPAVPALPAGGPGPADHAGPAERDPSITPADRDRAADRGISVESVPASAAGPEPVRESVAESCGCLVAELRRIEQGCRDQDERLTLLLAALPSPVLVADADRRVIAANQAFCDVFALADEPAGLIGRDCADLAHPAPELLDDPAAFAARLEELIRKRAAVMREEVAIADGRVFERSHVPVRHSDGYRGHLWVYVEVTDRRIIEAETDGLIAAGVVTADGRPVLPPPTRRADDRPPGRTDPYHRHVFPPAQRRPGPVPPASPLPAPRPASDAAPAPLDGARGGARGGALNGTVDAAVDEHRRDGAHELALDLRAPLASIVSYVGLLRDGVAGPLSAEQESLMGVVSAGAQALVEIVSRGVAPRSGPGGGRRSGPPDTRSDISPGQE